ncbi:phosphopantetheine-binding protein [Halodesulfovibrio sp. MK-HDV]|jgi:acyl carrier protein|uniref:phosphopantetheine-binding protein n=1 Tax=unclassified Halodesulfovibrio TaxID=2644657 RepID=UPI00136AD510|nr:phosphopantetheine-binding protein [Halodesulfovibrio sp. MK-HDV]KAF1074919.1 Acyl carrier protein [Halodesulfovibrio sp. MK-HDV]
MSNMHQKLKELFIEELHLEDISLEEWKSDTPLFGDGIGLDSLDAVEIVVFIEKHFGVIIENIDEDKKALTSIDTLADFIMEKQANA